MVSCSACGRKMQGRRNNGKPHYRCTFLSQYAAKNKVSHPTSAYLREEQPLLTSSYGLNDFAPNLVYAHLFPHFILPRTAKDPPAYREAGQYWADGVARRSGHLWVPA